MQLVIHTTDLRLTVKAGVFHLTDGEHERDISPELIDSIAVVSDCTLSASAIRLAGEAEVPIYFFDYFGEADACLRSPYFEALATRRRKQVYFSDHKAGAAWVSRQFALKTEGQIFNLKYLANRKRALRVEIEETIAELSERAEKLLSRPATRPTLNWSNRMMGWEGQSAKRYWRTLATALPTEWHFPRRSRRPAEDAYNALTNYFYGFLYARTEQALFAAGLDPHLGILHADEYDRPTLSYDLIEPFRPWVDRFLLQQIFQQKLSPKIAEKKEDGFRITQSSKKELIPAFNAFMESGTNWRGSRAKRNGQIYRHASDLSALIESSVQRPR